MSDVSPFKGKGRFAKWRIDRYIAKIEKHTWGGLIPDSQVTVFGKSSGRVYTLAELKQWRSEMK